MKPPALEFKVVSVNDQYEYNDWVDNRRHSSLLVDKLKDEKRLKDKSETCCSKAMIYKDFFLQCKVYRSTKSYVQLQCV